MSSFSPTEMFIDFDYACWKAVDECQQFKEDLKDGFFHISFNKKVEHMACPQDMLPTVLRTKEISSAPTTIFHVPIHDLLYPESGQRSIHKVLHQFLCLEPVLFQDIKHRISSFVSSQGKRGSMGCNTLSIVSNVEVLVTHFYKDEDAKSQGARDLNEEVNALISVRLL